jgi:6-pyruvoyltetrahydropterin/6-carboxytetrahydropterin synthase
MVSNKRRIIMYDLQVKRHFDAAHKLKDYEGKCQRLHGHRFTAEVTVNGQKLGDSNMIVDFVVIKKAMDVIIEAYLDHHYLNETLKEDNPTAEFIARWLYVELQFVLTDVNIKSITVWESPDCSASYSPTVGESA